MAAPNCRGCGAPHAARVCAYCGGLTPIKDITFGNYAPIRGRGKPVDVYVTDFATYEVPGLRAMLDGSDPEFEAAFQAASKRAWENAR